MTTVVVRVVQPMEHRGKGIANDFFPPYSHFRTIVADKMDLMEMLGNSQNKNKLSFDDLSDEQEDSDDESIPGLTDS